MINSLLTLQSARIMFVLM